MPHANGLVPDGTMDLGSRVAIVTGATSGIGYETALALAQRGATTILAARNPGKATVAVSRIMASAPGLRVRSEPLDLASLASVRRFADSIIKAYTAVDILVNNGAVMALPTRERTEDGFEHQIGVNYLAHFALTAHLLPSLCAAPDGGRVVNVASLAHRRAALDLADFNSERSYGPMRAYGRSKLAMLIFALELQRRADTQGWPLRSVAAHPGWARTHIIPNGPGRGRPGVRERLAEALFGLVAQPARAGALPILFAATAPDAMGGAYYGPTGFGETRGSVGTAHIFPQAADRAAGAALWDFSERLTGLSSPQP